MINILITDDHPVVRRGIRQILEYEEKIGVIHEAANSSQLFDLLKENKYDVILLDISMPGINGLDLIPEIKLEQGTAKVLILSIHSEDTYVLKALRRGASGYITKSGAPEELLSAIYKVSAGGKYLSSSLVDALALSMIEGYNLNENKRLSQRELEVLSLFAMGKTVVNIASELSISPKTVSTYRERLLKKLNLKNTAELMHYAIENANYLQNRSPLS